MIQVHDLRCVDTDVVEAWVTEIEKNLRQSDLDEIEAMAGVSPTEALRTSISLSTHAYAVVDGDGKACAIFGAAPHPLPSVGVVWMLGTDGIVREGFGIARRTRRFFDELGEAYPILWNYIDARNTVSLKWLRWGGFRLIGERDFQGHLFYIFARNAHV